MTISKPKPRITDEMLDQIVGDSDPTELFHGEDLFLELRQKLAERMLDAEMDVHLSQSRVRSSKKVR